MDNFGLENSDVLLEPGSFFSKVLFGNSHQGSAVNLLSGDAEVAAFDDVDVDMYSIWLQVKLIRSEQCIRSRLMRLSLLIVCAENSSRSSASHLC